MKLEDLVEAIVAFDALRARQWVLDAARVRLEWAELPEPRNLSHRDRAIAAGMAELLSDRFHQSPPEWTRVVPPVEEPIFLVRSAETMPRLRELCRAEGPLPLRRRNLYAPPDFLSLC